MTARRPLVSVCIPARNCGRYLGEALESVAAAGRADIEVVVFDDASTDATWQVARAHASPRVRCFRHRRQVGIPANRNSCLAEARGRHIAWLDGDDRLLPGALDALIDVVETRPEVGLVHGAFQVIAEDGRRLPDWPLPFDRDVVERGPCAFREMVLMNYVTAPVLVRRACHRGAGPYALDIGPGSTDWEMWLRMSLDTDLAYLSRPLSQYRQHAGSITAATRDGGRRLQCDAAAVARVFALRRRDIPDADALEARARAALRAKALLAARESVSRGDWPGAAAVLQRHPRGSDAPSGAAGRLLRLVGNRDEYGFHECSRRELARIRRLLGSTRFGARLRGVATRDPAWARTLRAIAATVRAVTPPGARLAAVDKWDPTLLHLAGRAGRHFPDRRLLPDGYPADGAAAVAHLQTLRRDGATHLVIPNAAFWWLEYYERFAGYLDARCALVWRDRHCVIYRLAPEAG